MRHRDNLNLCLEERGSNGRVQLEVEIYFHFDPGQRSSYDADEPFIGRPASATILYVSAMSAESDTWAYNRYERPDWFQWLDRVAMHMVLDDEDYYMQHCVEQALGL